MQKILSIRKALRSGFTLVELLIVIGLLAAIALIVIAAINPIEQANRARDARYQADGGQLISAVERYFAAHSAFPWETGSGCAGTGCVANSEAAFGFLSASAQSVGLCGADCTAGGLLISSDELKTEFLGRDWVTGVTADKQIQIGKGTGSSSSVYACYIPLAKSNRDKAIAAGKVHGLTFNANGTVGTTTACTTSSDDWTASACYTCIPD